jgi:hypothetical protein
MYPASATRPGVSGSGVRFPSPPTEKPPIVPVRQTLRPLAKRRGVERGEPAYGNLLLPTAERVPKLGRDFWRQRRTFGSDHGPALSTLQVSF